MLQVVDADEEATPRRRFAGTPPSAKRVAPAFVPIVEFEGAKEETDKQGTVDAGEPKISALKPTVLVGCLDTP